MQQKTAYWLTFPASLHLISNSRPNQPHSTPSSTSHLLRPHQRLLNLNEPSTTGRGLGVINRKYFEPATWELLLSTEVGRGQYSKFVAAMIERIRLKESSYGEIKSFVHLVATEHNWDFMELAMPYLTELKEPYPRDTKDFEIAHLFSLKPTILRRSIKVIPSTIPAPNTYKDGLSKSEEQLLKRNLFGPFWEAVDSPATNRLFKSTLELGYPQPVLDRSMREAEERGTDIERCSEGLPRNLLMPDTGTRPHSFSFSSHNHGAGTPEVWNTGISESNERFDSPPRDLLTELSVDGVDPPVPTAPNKTRTSHGDLSKLSRIGHIEAFVARRAESPNRPQVPCDEPPRIQYGPAEHKAFKAYYKEPGSEFLNYFDILERVADPPMSDWPTSPSTPGHSPIAAAPEPAQTDTNPAAIPKTWADVKNDCGST